MDDLIVYHATLGLISIVDVCIGRSVLVIIEYPVLWFGSAVLFGQIIIKVVSGLARTKPFGAERPVFFLSRVIVFGLVPSLVLSALLMNVNPIPWYLSWWSSNFSSLEWMDIPYLLSMVADKRSRYRIIVFKNKKSTISTHIKVILIRQYVFRAWYRLLPANECPEPKVIRLTGVPIGAKHFSYVEQFWEIPDDGVYRKIFR